MRHFTKFLLITFLLISPLFQFSPQSAQAAGCTSSVTDGSLKRLGGADRYATAALVSKDQFADKSAGAGIIATGIDYADGAVAGPLATLLGGTLLLATRTSLPGVTATELKRTVALDKPIYLLGGTAALGNQVENAVRALGYQDINRIAGVDRYSTAVAIAKFFPNNLLTQAAIARGDNYADALAMGAPAARDKFPILLTRPNSLPSTTRDFIASHSAIQVAHIAGGTAAVSTAVADQIKKLVPNTPLRYAGADRYATSVAITNEFYGSIICAVSLTSGLNFPDALVASVHAAKQSSGILLVRPDIIPDSVKTFLENHAASIKGGFIYGGTAAINKQVLITGQAMIEPASFVFFGDTREFNTHWSNLAGVITNLTNTDDIDGIFVLGDNCSATGPTSASDPCFSTIYKTPLANVIKNHKLEIALGNHDVQAGYSQGQYSIDYGSTHNYWHEPSRYFAQTLEHVRLVTLDTNDYGTDKISSKQLQFLRDNINSDADALHTIVFGHHPVYSSGEHGLANDQPWMKSQVEPILFSADVEFYLAGHDHNFEALIPKKVLIIL